MNTWLALAVSVLPVVAMLTVRPLLDWTYSRALAGARRQLVQGGHP